MLELIEIKSRSTIHSVLLFLFWFLFAFVSVVSALAENVVRFNYPQYRGVAWDWCIYRTKDCDKQAEVDFCCQKRYSHTVHY